MNIALGTAAIGRPHYINIRTQAVEKPFNKEAFIQEGKQLLSNAYQKGIRHFDTAPGYGIAESILLEWIAENQPNDITVSTKWGYTYTAGFNPNASVHEVKEHSLEKLNEQWETSKQLLPYLNIYQIHSATLDSGVLANEAVLNRLHEIKETHNIAIGLSVSGDNQNEIIEKALTIQVNEIDLFDCIQVTYNVFDQSLLQLAPRLKDKKLIIKEALANGRVFPNSNYPNYKASYEVLNQLATKHKVAVDAIALRFCMETLNPYAVLSGAALPEHLESNLQARDISFSLEEIELLKSLACITEDYWKERKQLLWN